MEVEKSIDDLLIENVKLRVPKERSHKPTRFAIMFIDNSGKLLCYKNRKINSTSYVTRFIFFNSRIKLEKGFKRHLLRIIKKRFWAVPKSINFLTYEESTLHKTFYFVAIFTRHTEVRKYNNLFTKYCSDLIYGDTRGPLRGKLSHLVAYLALANPQIYANIIQRRLFLDRRSFIKWTETKADEIYEKKLRKRYARANKLHKSNQKD